MADATLAQGNELDQRILREDDPREFLQRVLGNFGIVQMLGRGEVTQAELIEALKNIETNAQTPKIQEQSIQKQVQLFLADLPQLDVSHVEENVAMTTAWMDPAAAGLFCYVRTETMATHFGIAEPWDNFGDLTEKTLGLLVTHRKFYTYRSGQLGTKSHRLYASTKATMQRIEAQQKGDIIVIPAQLGSLYRGKSVQTSRDLIGKSGNQFCLPAFIVGQILLVNPDILTNSRDWFIDCPGDECRLGGGRELEDALCFFFDGGGLCLGDRWSGGSRNDCGSASGFFQ
jgi:hypothetical protein